MTVTVKNDDPKMDAFIAEARGWMGEAIAAVLQLASTSYKDAIEENARLRKRVEYLETRVHELEGKRAA